MPKPYSVDFACMNGRGDQAWRDTGGSCRAIRREPRLRCALSAGWTAKQGVSVRLSSVGTRSMSWQRRRNWSGDWWQPDITLAELQLRLAKAEIKVRQSSIFRFLRHAKMTFKIRRAAEQDRSEVA